MKVIVNFPQTKEGIELLENNVANFRATIVLKTVKNLKISNNEKKKILDEILKKLEN